MLSIENFSFNRSGNVVISDVSFEMEEGSNVEIIGSNGSGKTTLLRAILGFIPEVKGNILWEGNDITMSRHSFFKSCFYQGHSLALKSILSVGENLKYSSAGFNSTKKEILAAVSRVGMEGFLDQSISELSVGQKKRVAIAKWLLKEKKIYLIDEPFTALDDEGRKLICSIVDELNMKGISFLITGHRPSSIKSKEIYL